MSHTLSSQVFKASNENVGKLINLSRIFAPSNPPSLTMHSSEPGNSISNTAESLRSPYAGRFAIAVSFPKNNGSGPPERATSLPDCICECLALRCVSTTHSIRAQLQKNLKLESWHGRASEWGGGGVGWGGGGVGGRLPKHDRLSNKMRIASAPPVPPCLNPAAAGFVPSSPLRLARLIHELIGRLHRAPAAGPEAGRWRRGAARGPLPPQGTHQISRTLYWRVAQPARHTPSLRGAPSLEVPSKARPPISRPAKMITVGACASPLRVAIRRR